jgi:hypothetical protein
VWNYDTSRSDPLTTVSFRFAFTNTSNEPLVVQSVHIYVLPTGVAIQPGDEIVAGKDMAPLGLEPTQTDTRAISGEFLSDGDTIVIQVSYRDADETRSRVIYMELPKHLSYGTPTPV